jgi:FkbM family methyltransferase
MPNDQKGGFSSPESKVESTERALGAPSPREGDPLVSYSQNAEDVRLWRVFGGVERGFYVDIGAGDPVEYSVTKLFYDRGWSGINIEPGPAFSALAAERTRDVNLNLAVGPEEGVRDFWVSSPHSGISTFYPSAAVDVLPEGFRYERVAVESIPAWRVLEEHAADRSIDFMSIDVEGAEADVIRSINFDTTRPTVLVVEAITFGREPSHEVWESIVLDADYLFAAFDGVNRFYVDRAHRDLVPALAYPISVLDGFVTAVFHETQIELHESQLELRERQFALRKTQLDLEAQQAETESLRQRTSELQSELAGVYASRIWRAGMALATAANPLIGGARRLRRLRRVPPRDAYAATVAPRQAWHFARGEPLIRGAQRGTLVDGLVKKFGPPDAVVTPARASELEREVNRINWTDEEALLQKQIPWVERQAVIETDAVIRLASGLPASTALERSSLVSTSKSVVAVDARCLQDPSYRQRGVGLHSRFVLEATRAIADAHTLVLLTNAELPALDANVAAMADRIISTPYALRDDDVTLFVQLSPMTASVAPTVPLLADEHCKSVSIVYDFIPSRFPRAYLGSPVDVLTNRVRIEALRHYNLLLPISEATADDCQRFLGEAVNVRVTGVADPLRDAAASAPVHVPGSFVLVPIGGDPRKNAAAAIAALAQHRSSTGDALHAVVTGTLTGGQAAALRKLARQLALPDDEVRLQSSLSKEELASLYKNADVVLVPSFAEEFSIPVVEAVLRSTPVVASDIPAHRELLGAGAWLSHPDDIDSLADAITFVRQQRATVIEQQRRALGTKSEADAVSKRITIALTELLGERPRHERTKAPRRRRPRLAVISPFPPQRSGVADYTEFTFRHVAKYADVEAFSAASPTTGRDLTMRPLSADPYLDRGFDAVINVLGNSHFHFPILDLMGAYGGACIAHDNRMVEAYRHDRGDPWTAELISRPSMVVREEQLVDLVNDLDRLPSHAYDIIARQASPLIVHGRALAENIFHDTGVQPVVVPFVPYNVPSCEVIDDAVVARARKALGLADDLLHVGTFGIVDRRTKGIGYIVAALGWLRNWNIRTCLHIVGYSPMVEALSVHRLASDLDISDDIVLHGHVPRPRLEQLLLALDVAVQLRTSSRLSLSGGVADCIAFGVPTVTTEIVAQELDAPSYVVRCPTIVSSLLVAEAIAALRDRRRTDMAAIEADRREYLQVRSADRYAQSVLAALGLGSH